MFIRIAGICLLSAFGAMAQDPIHMDKYPYPEKMWYLRLDGMYGVLDENTAEVIPEIETFESRCEGLVGDKVAERVMALGFPQAFYRTRVRILTEKGESRPFMLIFQPLNDAPEIKSFEVYAQIQDPPIGFRFYDEKGKLFAEARWDDPGSLPTIKVWQSGPSEVNWEIIPKQDPDTQTHERQGLGFVHGISTDGGKTWDERGGWGHYDEGPYQFLPGQLAATPNPIIRFVTYYRLRRYVKYYVFGKGFAVTLPNGDLGPVAAFKNQSKHAGKSKAGQRKN